MAEDTIKIQNVKGIKELVYTLPTEKGVYLLTGVNGTGKTTLLVALNRLGVPSALRGLASPGSGDTLIAYTIGEDQVVYKRGPERWAPSPRANARIIANYPYHRTYYLSAKSSRLYQQENNDLSAQKYSVDQTMKEAMNEIFATDRFGRLQYRCVTWMQGRQTTLHRENKLYVLTNSSESEYTERDFSLGEILVLNALDFIADVEQSSMLLIDEIELALHPIAQVKFYEYLERIARERDLIVVISTHSSTLIKKATKIHYLENSNGVIRVLNDVRPAYVLKDLSVEEDNRPDYLFFVEDDMARRYLAALLKALANNFPQLNGLIFRILPVGGYENVVKLMTHFYGLSPFSKRNVHSFLDADVKDEYDRLKDKPDPTPSEKNKIELFERHRENLDYLPITPELGIWEELILDSEWFRTALVNKYRGIMFDVRDMISKVNSEVYSNNERTRAKGCFKNLLSKIQERNPDILQGSFFDLLVESYVVHKWEDVSFQNQIRGMILKIINRR